MRGGQEERRAVLIKEIIEAAIERMYRSRIRVSACHTNRASKLGHPCLRHLVLLRTVGPEKVQAPSSRTMRVFERGHTLHDAVISELREAGITILERERDHFWRELEISGHTDAMVLPPGIDPITDGKASWPAEIKSINTWAFNSIDTLQDMHEAKQYWVRGYPAQLTTYLLLEEREHGLFILKEPMSWQTKVIELPLDFEYAEGLLKKAEAINAHIEQETLPERMPYGDACAHCEVRGICVPDIHREEWEIDVGELSEKLDRLAELEPASREYNKLKKEVSKEVKGRPRVLAGNWLVEGKLMNRKGYTVGESEYWSWKRTAVEAKKDSEAG